MTTELSVPTKKGLQTRREEAKTQGQAGRGCRSEVDTHLKHEGREPGRHEDKVAEASGGALLVNAGQQGHFAQLPVAYNLHGHLQDDFTLLFVQTWEQQDSVKQAGHGQGTAKAVKLVAWPDTQGPARPPPAK